MTKYGYIPPTPEQWRRVPIWLKLKIILILVWEVLIKRGLWELGLILGGIDPR